MRTPTTVALVAGLLLVSLGALAPTASASPSCGSGYQCCDDPYNMDRLHCFVAALVKDPVGTACTLIACW